LQRQGKFGKVTLGKSRYSYQIAYRGNENKTVA